MRLFFQKIVFGGWLNNILFILSIYAFYSTYVQALRAVTNWSNVNVYIFSILWVFITISFVFFFFERIKNIVLKILFIIDGIPLWVIVLAGFFLRGLWVVLFDAAPGSDGEIYMALAEKIRNGQPYEIANSKAYWPVGYPLVLSGMLLVFDDNKIAYLLLNFLAYFIAIFGVFKLTIKLNKGRFGNLAAFIFSIWPNLIFNVATPEKEMLIISILPWATLLLLDCFEKKKIKSSFSSGLLLGLSTLIQPSLQLLPFLGGALMLVVNGITKESLTKFLLLMAGAVIVIFPWSLRNYNEFDRFVLVSTNGGGNFYRANNPIATGGYTKRGEVDISNLNELEQDRKGKVLAKEWILNNPLDFVSLSIEKQIRFMGDDSVGVYNTFKVGGVFINNKIYVFLKSLSNFFWLLVWFFLAVLVLTKKEEDSSDDNLVFIVLWLWLYLFVIHSVFESAGKYHVPVIWVLCIIIAYYCNRLQKGMGNKVFSLGYEKRKQRSRLLSELFRFLCVGGLATTIQYIILIILVRFFNYNVVLASGIGFVISAIFNYYLNYRFTFLSASSHVKAMPKFILIALLGLGINNVVIWVFYTGFNVHYLISQLFATSGTIFWNFMWNKLWTFKSNTDVSNKVLVK